MFKKLFQGRFALLFSFMLTYLTLSTILRLILLIWSIAEVDLQISDVLQIFGFGLYFDIGTLLFFSVIYSLYLLFFPKRFIGSITDRILSYFMMGLMLFISIFSIIGEVPFWEEFSHRYNFIAVDYLIYTYEVVQNINQSYPIPLILILLSSVIFALFYLFQRKKILQHTFSAKPGFSRRSIIVIPIILLAFVYGFFSKNQQAEWSANTYENELSKNGVFSLLAAYISNELDYKSFYQTLPEKEAYALLKDELDQKGAAYLNLEKNGILRKVDSKNNFRETPNIIVITVESLSAEFLGIFGNKEKLTPNLDQLAMEGLSFTKMYATGTRTVRGMEALTLCVPPSPGQSIVRRNHNEHLFSIASVLREKNYALNFIYGGDGYFDNMNYFFGSQGFDIIDRDRGNPLSDDINTQRFPIKDSEVTFENAWGICDGDLYKQALKRADLQSTEGKPFFQFIMTTSNHRPYSFPENALDMPQGNRESAIKYTDLAIGNFIKEAKTKEWFNNTVFVIVADHCASSAGKWELNIEQHHIPAIIYNLKDRTGEVDVLASQIDLMPTLFGLLDWNFETEFYGLDIFKMNPETERTYIGNYRTLGLLKDGILTQLNDKKEAEQFQWDFDQNELSKLNSKPIDSLISETIALYQTQSERFKSGAMQEDF